MPESDFQQFSDIVMHIQRLAITNDNLLRRSQELDRVEGLPEQLQLRISDLAFKNKRLENLVQNERKTYMSEIELQRKRVDGQVEILGQQIRDLQG